MPYLRIAQRGRVALAGALLDSVATETVPPVAAILL